MVRPSLELMASAIVCQCLLSPWVHVMKVRNSIKSLKTRHRDCRVIRRKGRIYVINKTNRRFKARQG